jgi:hypothetical protein
MAFDYALGFSQQLITLSSAILVLSITLMKDVLKTPEQRERRMVLGAWLLYLVTIGAGLWAEMALTGAAGSVKRALVLDWRVRTPVFIQLFAFLGASILFTVVAIRGINRLGKPVPDPEPPEGI